MKSWDDGNGTYLVELEPGDKLVETVADFLEEAGISDAQITGEGSVENPSFKIRDPRGSGVTARQISGIYNAAVNGGAIYSDSGGTPRTEITLNLTGGRDDSPDKTVSGALIEAVCAEGARIWIRAAQGLWYFDPPQGFTP